MIIDGQMNSKIRVFFILLWILTWYINLIITQLKYSNFTYILLIFYYFVIYSSFNGPHWS